MTNNKSLAKHSPIELGIWLFILADMCIFGLYFWVFAWDKSQLPEQFSAGQASLNTFYGAFNTIALLVSSYFIATAVQAARTQNSNVFSRCIKLTMLCGFVFLMVKAVEYTEKFNAGFHIASNTFYRDYFAFTGFHMLHVMIGLSLLAYILFESRKPKYISENTGFIEGSALYWHMVDLLWVVLFSLIYLVV